MRKQAPKILLIVDHPNNEATTLAASKPVDYNRVPKSGGHRGKYSRTPNQNPDRGSR